SVASTPPCATLLPYTTLFRSPKRTAEPARRANQRRCETPSQRGGSSHRPRSTIPREEARGVRARSARRRAAGQLNDLLGMVQGRDRKSTRLNSSHVKISYAVF